MLYENKEREKLFCQHIVKFCEEYCESEDCETCYIGQVYTELKKKEKRKED